MLLPSITSISGRAPALDSEHAGLTHVIRIGRIGEDMSSHIGYMCLVSLARMRAGTHMIAVLAQPAPAASFLLTPVSNASIGRTSKNRI